MNKRGSTHIEIILSMVLFVGFVLFLFYIVNPFEVSKEGSQLTKTFAPKILNEIKTSFYKVTIIIGNPSSEIKCFKVSPKLNSEFNNIRVGGWWLQSGYFSQPISGIGITATQTLFFKSSSSSEELGIIHIFQDPDDDSSSGSLPDCNPPYDTPADIPTCEEDINCDLGVIHEVKVYSYHNIKDLKNCYDNNYNSLKNSLGIFGGNDFIFKVFDNTGGEISTLSPLEDAPKEKSVSVRDIYISVLIDDHSDTSETGYVFGETKEMLFKLYTY